jgi:hypothetical protein
LGYVYGYEPRPVLMRSRVQERPARWAKQAPRKTVRWMPCTRAAAAAGPAAPTPAPLAPDVAALDDLLATDAHLDNVVELTPFTPEQKREYGQQIYDALIAAGGQLDGGVLIKRTGISAATAFRVLQEMLGDGVLLKTGDTYQLPQTTEEIAK